MSDNSEPDRFVTSVTARKNDTPPLRLLCGRRAAQAVGMRACRAAFDARRHGAESAEFE